MHLPQRVGDKIARLIGAEERTVVAADSTSINLFKVLSAALDLNPAAARSFRSATTFRLISISRKAWPSRSARVTGWFCADTPEDIPDMLDEDVAVLMLTHVNYRNGYRHDMAALTKAAHDKGILVIWDLAHTAGAMPVDLAGAQADFAIGCGYKYLNGGPGAPAFLYVNPRHQGGFRQPLSGWFGHRAPFDFDSVLCAIKQHRTISVRDAAGAWRWSPWTRQCRCGMMSTWTAVRAKSIGLCDFFIQEVGAFAEEFGLTLVTPRDSGPARQPGVLFLRQWLCHHAGVDCARRDRRFPCAGYHSLRHDAALPELRGGGAGRGDSEGHPCDARLGPT